MELLFVDDLRLFALVLDLLWRGVLPAGDLFDMHAGVVQVNSLEDP